VPHYAKYNHDAYITLEQVVTVQEAARRLGVWRTTIDRAIDSNNIPAVKCGAITLVHWPSCVKWIRRKSDV
jgi:excisionase family DNA binding protein